MNSHVLSIVKVMGYPVSASLIILSISKTNQMHQCTKFILFGVTLHVFRTVFPSIIRSSRLYIQKQAFVKQIMLSASTCFGTSFRPSSGVQDCTYSNRHLSNRYCCLPLHVSDGLSVHHQEFKTVHTATGICQTDTTDCLLASKCKVLNNFQQ